MQQAGDDAQQRRFAGAGAPEQGDHLTLMQGQVDVVEHHQVGVGVLVVGLTAAPHFQQGGGGVGRDGGIHSGPPLASGLLGDVQ